MSLSKIKSGKLKGYIVCGQLFPRQQDVKERVQQILHSTAINSAVDDEGRVFLMELIDAHENAAGKIGVGVAEIVVRRNRKFRQPEFWIIREDGSETDFSFYKCISSSCAETYTKRAFRYPVEDQIDDYRRSYLHESGDGTSAPCEHCGKPTTPKESHIDHIPPDTFDEILAGFLKESGLELADVELTESMDGQIGRHLADDELASAWADYHSRHAKLRYVNWICNLSEIKTEDSE